MKKPHSYTERSTVRCGTAGCNTFIKMNVLERKESPKNLVCYPCHTDKERARKLAQGARADKRHYSP
jgi:hypothetical protein